MLSFKFHSLTTFIMEHLTLLLLGLILCFIYVVFCCYAFILDLEELEQIKVEFFQDSISQSSIIYSLSLTIKERIVKTGKTDLIVRLRGSLKDAPLVLYRDVTRKFYRPRSVITIGIALPFNIGKPLELDIACDNTSNKSSQPTIAISDIYVRKYPRWSLNKARSSTSNNSLTEDHEEVFSSLSSNVEVWACLDTITNTQGAGIIGVNRRVRGHDQVLRSRSNARTYRLTKEDPELRRIATLHYRPQHYIFSLSSKWHDAWSDFSRLDRVFVLLLDQLAGIAAVSVSFAFGLEEYFGIPQIREIYGALHPGVSFKEINKFDLAEFFGSFNAVDFVPYIVNVVHITWMAILCSIVIIPLSLLWCRLFRVIGGKGFEKVLGRTKSAPVDELQPSAGRSLVETESEPVATSLMLRTLECRNIHSGFCTTSNRRLKVEPMICNFAPDYDVARTVAFARSKMAHLRDESVPSGPKGIKNPELFHESHTQSTDAPIMPQPSTSIDGKGHILRVGRYCERVVQQATESIFDNAVIAECFEVAPKKIDKKKTPSHRNMKRTNNDCCHKSVSDATFFSEEDAKSVKELVRIFTPRDLCDVPEAESNADRNVAEKDIESESKIRDAKIMKTTIGRKAATNPTSPETNKQSSNQVIHKLNKSEIHESIKGKAKGPTSSGGIVNSVFARTTPEQSTIQQASSRSSATYDVTGNDAVYIGSRMSRGHTRTVLDTISDEIHEINDTANSDLSDSGYEFQSSSYAAPFPSGKSFPITSASLKHQKQLKMVNEIDDTKLTRTPSFCCRQLFKRKKKAVVFFFMVIFQLFEIFVVTSIPANGLNQFYSRSSMSRIELIRGRMQAAFLSCLLCLVIYFFFTLQLITLLSQQLDRCLYAKRNNKTIQNSSSKCSI